MHASMPGRVSGSAHVALPARVQRLDGGKEQASEAGAHAVIQLLVGLLLLRRHQAQRVQVEAHAAGRQRRERRGHRQRDGRRVRHLQHPAGSTGASHIWGAAQRLITSCQGPRRWYC